MARYKVLEKSFINNTLYDIGAEVEYEGEVGPNLELVTAEPKEAKGKKTKDEGAAGLA